MSKELEAFRDILGILSAVSGCEVDMNSERVKIVEQALQRLEAIDNSNPSEALEVLGFMGGYIIPTANGNKYLKDFCDREFDTIKQALLKAQEDKKKLNEIEKLTHLFYSERRKIGQEYVKWCKENNTVFNDETNMITWVLAIKLKEWLK